MTSKLHGKTSAQRLQASLWGKLRVAAVVGLSATAACAAWASPTASFVVTDLTDTVAGQDLWRYDYTVSGPIDANGLMNLLFSPASYASLVSETSDPNLTLLPDVQPDAGLPADGIVQFSLNNALLAADAAALSVRFIWLGAPGSSPGAQLFEVVDGAGNPAGGGMTTLQGVSSVPEPSTLLLSTTALLALSVKRRRGFESALGKHVSAA